MSKYEIIENKIEQYLQEEEKQFEKCFLGGVSLEKIKLVEKRLEIVFPKSYIFFLEKYGSGGVEGIVFWGIEGEEVDIEKATIVLITEEYRKKGLPHNLVVFEETGEYVVCLDTSRIDEEGECPVVTWSDYDNDGVVFSEKNFYMYFLNKLDDYL